MEGLVPHHILMVHFVNAGGAFYAATPPLECKRMLFSGYATRRTGRTGAVLKLSFIDIKKAYFNGVPKRKIYLMLPRELGLPSSTLGFLVRCAYGTRDAGAIWEETYADALVELGFRRGVASPCCFFHESRDISIVVHGDDFTALGEASDLKWYEEGLAKFSN